MDKPRGAPTWGPRTPRPSEVSRDRSESKPGPLRTQRPKVRLRPGIAPGLRDLQPANRRRRLPPLPLGRRAKAAIMTVSKRVICGESRHGHIWASKYAAPVRSAKCSRLVRSNDARSGKEAGSAPIMRRQTESQAARVTFRAPFRRVPGAEAARSSPTRPPGDFRPTLFRGATSSESAG